MIVLYITIRGKQYNFNICECMEQIKGSRTLESRIPRPLFCVDIILSFKDLRNTSPKSIGEVKKA